MWCSKLCKMHKKRHYLFQTFLFMFFISSTPTCIVQCCMPALTISAFAPRDRITNWCWSEANTTDVASRQSTRVYISIICPPSCSCQISIKLSFNAVSQLGDTKGIRHVRTL